MIQSTPESSQEVQTQVANAPEASSQNELPITPPENLPRPPAVGPKVWTPNIAPLTPDQMREEVAAENSGVPQERKEPTGGPLSWVTKFFKGS